MRVWQGLKSHAASDCPFNVWTDVESSATFTLGVPSSFRNCLGGMAGSVLDVFGGEFEWDRYTVRFHKAAVVRQDITIPVERSDEPSQELVYEAKPGDFISAESFRATKQKTGTLNVAAYIRVSTDSSDQENSYETQERYFNQLIEANPEWNPIGVYSDYGISGTNSEKRTGFRRLLRHCKAGKIDRVICKSISRFARNTADFMMALDLLRENNVTILFEKENLDTADPTSEFILTTLGAIAQEESRSISGNINLGNKMRFKRGDVRNVVVCIPATESHSRQKWKSECLLL